MVMDKFTKPYTEAMRAGEIDYDEIDNYIEYWHKHDTGNSLQDFLGMTKDEFVKYVKYGDRYIFDILGIEVDPPEMPVCKMCGRELGVRMPDGGIICSSSYIENNAYCYECQVEHCMSTNCLGCEIGSYPDCKHLETKKFYLEEQKQNALEKADCQEEGESDAP
jgi:hypothetical protein